MNHNAYLNSKTTLVWLQITALLLLLAFPGKAHACSCDIDPSLSDTESIKKSFENEYNRIVFVGEVTEVQEITRLSDLSRPVFPIFVTFAVDTVYRGEIAAEFTLTTDSDSGTCGYDFRVGKTYLVFVGDGGGEDSYYTGLCANNRVNPSAEMLAAPGEGYAPLPGGDTGALESDNDAVDTPETASNTQPYILIAAGIAITSLIVYGLFQYRSDDPFAWPDD